MRSRPSYVRGTKVLGEGKTKILFEVVNEPDLIDVHSKDDITAGDGAKHDVIDGKGRVSNETACNIFDLLGGNGIPVAFVQKSGPNSFISQKCAMFPYEIVVRREAFGSYCQRHPKTAKGTVFPQLIVEFFLKTKGRKWKDRDLVCDDPFMIADSLRDVICLYDPHKPIEDQKPFLTLPSKSVFLTRNEWQYFPDMERIARDSFALLERHFAELGYRYVDFKIECGLNRMKRVVMADLIDSDSGRLLDAQGNHVDKQYYREGGDIDKLIQKFHLVMELTRRFKEPV